MSRDVALTSGCSCSIHHFNGPAHELFGRNRASTDQGFLIRGTWKRKLSQRRLERYDWAEALIDALSPESRTGLGGE